MASHLGDDAWCRSHWCSGDIRRERMTSRQQRDCQKRDRHIDMTAAERRELNREHAEKRRAFRRELHLKNIESWRRREEVLGNSSAPDGRPRDLRSPSPQPAQPVQRAEPAEPLESLAPAAASIAPDLCEQSSDAKGGVP